MYTRVCLWLHTFKKSLTAQHSHTQKSVVIQTLDFERLYKNYELSQNELPRYILSYANFHVSIIVDLQTHPIYYKGNFLHKFACVFSPTEAQRNLHGGRNLHHKQISGTRPGTILVYTVTAKFNIFPSFFSQKGIKKIITCQMM